MWGLREFPFYTVYIFWYLEQSVHWLQECMTRTVNFRTQREEKLLILQEKWAPRAKNIKYPFCKSMVLTKVLCLGRIPKEYDSLPMITSPYKYYRIKQRLPASYLHREHTHFCISRLLIDLLPKSTQRKMIKWWVPSQLHCIMVCQLGFGFPAKAGSCFVLIIMRTEYKKPNH